MSAPVFPQPSWAPNQDSIMGWFGPAHGGITKRELFAGFAMQALIHELAYLDKNPAKEFAEAAVEFADALIAELAK